MYAPNLVTLCRHFGDKLIGTDRHVVGLQDTIYGLTQNQATLPAIWWHSVGRRTSDFGYSGIIDAESGRNKSGFVILPLSFILPSAMF